MGTYIALPIVGFIVGLLIVSLGGGGGAVYVGIVVASEVDAAIAGEI